jgi:hypothetical protein
MDLQSRKILFVQEFLNLQNEEIIQSLEDLLKFKKEEKSREEISPMNINQFYREIDQSLDDSEQERVLMASELKARYLR